jgi:hypothetical protein
VEASCASILQQIGGNMNMQNFIRDGTLLTIGGVLVMIAGIFSAPGWWQDVITLSGLLMAFTAALATTAQFPGGRP